MHPVGASLFAKERNTMLNAEPSTTSDIPSKKASNDMSIVPAPPPTHHLLSYLETGNCVESTPARNWNYRVIEFVTEDGEVWRSIHEVHYVDGVPKAYSERPAPIMWERDDGEAAALVTLEQMREAMSKPVLGEMDFHPDDSGHIGQFSIR
jgi:hypothetical protein